MERDLDIPDGKEEGKDYILRGENAMRKEISNIFKEWKQEAGVKGIILLGVFPGLRDTIKVCTDKPGFTIGKGGSLLDKYKERLKEYNSNLEHIEFVETDSWYIK